jgi:hypothetical protein
VKWNDIKEKVIFIMYMVKGGYIFMHDTFNGGPLETLVKEILNEGKYCVVISNPNFLLKKNEV